MIVREMFCSTCFSHLAPEQFTPKQRALTGNKRKCIRCEQRKREADKARLQRMRA